MVDAVHQILATYQFMVRRKNEKIWNMCNCAVHFNIVQLALSYSYRIWNCVNFELCCIWKTWFLRIIFAMESCSCSLKSTFLLFHLWIYIDSVLYSLSFSSTFFAIALSSLNVVRLAWASFISAVMSQTSSCF